MADPARDYSQQKYFLNIIDTFYGIALILFFLGTGLSVYLQGAIESLGLPGCLSIALFLLAAFLLYYLFRLPLNFYAGFTLEHKFNLSRQNAGSWWVEQLKSFLLAYIILLILILCFYWILAGFKQWWLVVSVSWIAFSVVLAKLTPVLIIPLFFKYKRLEDDLLRQRIFDLARRMRVKFMDVFEIDFSKKTLKANAAFTGIGKSRRVILADTLKDKYTTDEIEAILAHEFAHFQRSHIFKLIAVDSILTLGLFYLIFRTNVYFLGVFGLDSLKQLAGLPLVFLYFMLFGFIVQPFGAYVSRRFEREADGLALQATRNKEAFISMMDKLAGQNLADRKPHPLIKLFFFDHPPIDERIKTAREFAG
ncbi:MAG: M48 family metallopeptidase [Candidatus Omnitrophica bacterium]|nr:M48 family metallopeptidase [Candidatus Omnitrophota bacterium]